MVAPNKVVRATLKSASNKLPKRWKPPWEVAPNKVVLAKVWSHLEALQVAPNKAVHGGKVVEAT
jgi:hypothetical protein